MSQAWDGVSLFVGLAAIVRTLPLFLCQMGAEEGFEQKRGMALGWSRTE